jgi:hypothetical protein
MYKYFNSIGFILKIIDTSRLKLFDSKVLAIQAILLKWCTVPFSRHSQPNNFGHMDTIPKSSVQFLLPQKFFDSSLRVRHRFNSWASQDQRIPTAKYLVI